jgi:hypothetical protein
MVCNSVVYLPVLCIFASLGGDVEVEVVLYPRVVWWLLVGKDGMERAVLVCACIVDFDDVEFKTVLLLSS